MNRRLRSPAARSLIVAALLGGLVAAGHAGPGCPTCLAPKAVAANSTENPAADAAKPVGHPLRGVVVEVLADQQALLVEHEEIPGVMRAMTMVLKVDAATLAARKPGDAITATLLRKPDGWWIENVKPAAAATKP